MKIILEFTTEELKENQGKTIADLIAGKAPKDAKKPVKKVKPEPEEEEEETDEEEEEETDEEESEADEEETEIDAEMIKEAIGKAVTVGNKVKVAALFAKFKAKTISNLKETQYAKFYDGLKPLTKKSK